MLKKKTVKSTTPTLEIPDLTNHDAYRAAAAKLSELRAKLADLKDIENRLLDELTSIGLSGDTGADEAVDRLLTTGIVGDLKPKQRRLNDELIEARKAIQVFELAVKRQQQTLAQAATDANREAIPTIVEAYRPFAERQFKAFIELVDATSAAYDARQLISRKGFNVADEHVPHVRCVSNLNPRNYGGPVFAAIETALRLAILTIDDVRHLDADANSRQAWEAATRPPKPEPKYVNKFPSGALMSDIEGGRNAAELRKAANAAAQRAETARRRADYSSDSEVQRAAEQAERAAQLAHERAKQAAEASRKETA